MYHIFSLLMFLHFLPQWNITSGVIPVSLVWVSLLVSRECFSPGHLHWVCPCEPFRWLALCPWARLSWRSTAFPASQIFLGCHLDFPGSHWLPRICLLDKQMQSLFYWLWPSDLSWCRQTVPDLHQVFPPAPDLQPFSSLLYQSHQEALSAASPILKAAHNFSYIHVIMAYSSWKLKGLKI